MSITIRQVLVVISSGIMLYFGITLLQLPVKAFQEKPISHYFEPYLFHDFIFGALFFGIILTVMGIICLYKSKLIRTIIHRYS